MRAYPCRSANAPSGLPSALVQWPRPYRRGEGPIVGVRVGLTILLAASALLSLVAAAAWLVGVFPEREAVGQTSRDPTITAPPFASPAPPCSGCPKLEVLRHRPAPEQSFR